MTAEIKSCPFCGGEPSHDKMMDESLWSHSIVPWRRVYCATCEIGTDYVCEGFEPSEVEAWNRRALDARDARIAELEAELVALKAPAAKSGSLPETDQINDLPATPWYPDDSGEWVEVPEDLMEMPAGLAGDTKIYVLLLSDRQQEYFDIDDVWPASDWVWDCFPQDGSRIVAYKVVKP